MSDEQVIERQATDPKTSVGEKLLGALGQVRGFWAFLFLLLTAVVSGLVDPDFGFNAKSLRLVCVFVAVFLLLNYTGGFIKWAVAKQPGVKPRLVARPVYLIILIITVIFARGTGIEPALVFGTVIALDYATQDVGEQGSLTQKRAAYAAIAGAVWAFVLGFAAWLAYTYIAHHPFSSLVRWEEIAVERAVLLDDTLNFASLIAIEFCFALAIAAIGSMPLMLLPLKLFDGGAIWRWNTSVWLVMYVVALVLYSHVLVPMPGSWEELNGTTIAWVIVFVAYAVFAVAVALAFKIVRKREEQASS